MTVMMVTVLMMMVMMILPVVVVVVVIILIVVVVVVVVGLVVIVLAKEIAIVTQCEFITRHQLALAQGATEALDVIDFTLGSHHKIRATETQSALVALGTE